VKEVKDLRIVLVTCGSADEADRIAHTVVEKRLAACVNCFEAPVRSVYWWKDKVESSEEHLLLIKTEKRLLGKLYAEVRRLHLYELPEFIALPIVSGSERYLDWMTRNLRLVVKPDRASARKRPFRRSSRPA